MIAFGAIARGFFYPATTQIFTPIKCVAIMFGSGFINSVTIRSISGSLYTTDGTQITLSNINDQTDKLLILGSDVTIGWKFS